MQGRGGDERRRRPWNVPFENIVRKILSRLSPLPQDQSPETKPPPPLSGRHAIYNRQPFSALNPHSKPAMSHSEAGKRIGHVSVCYNGKLVIWGGYNDERLNRNYPTNELWVYDPLIHKWSLWRCMEKRSMRDDMPPGTSGATSCLIGSDMYIFGGYTMTGNVNTIYRINLSLIACEMDSDSRSENRVTIEKIRPANAEDAPIPSDKNVSWSHEGKFFVFGGYGYEPERSDRYRHLMPRDSLFLPDPGSNWQMSSRRGWNNQLACFDPASGLWSYPKVQGQWPVPRAAHAAAKLGSRVLIFGGRHDRNRVNDLWLLDLHQMTWKELKCGFAPEGRSWHSLTAISSEEVLLYGGLSTTRQALADSYVYNIRLNRWIAVAVRSEPRLWHSAVFSEEDQQVFIYGGGRNDILDHSVKTSEIYTNDLITMRFCPDSLTRLCLDACTSFSHTLMPLFHELPHSLQQILRLRIEADH